jgi:hypothetical protein
MSTDLGARGALDVEVASGAGLKTVLISVQQVALIVT